jgi:hypothetical protein
MPKEAYLEKLWDGIDAWNVRPEANSDDPQGIPVFVIEPATLAAADMSPSFSPPTKH